MKDNEIRSLESKDNLLQDEKMVTGYAMLFNRRSNPMKMPNKDIIFYEVIDNEAINAETIQRSDVFATLNHDKNKGILARSKNGEGSLQLTIDEKGLMYSFEVPDTQLGSELRSYLERGEICESSFAFTVQKDKWEKIDGKTYLRTIEKIDKLFDVSPVYSPAYSDTYISFATRSLDEFIGSEKEEKEEKPILNNNKKEKKMKKEFRLLDAINSYVNGRNFTDEQLAVIEAGKRELRDAGQTFAGSIQLPMEYRATDPGSIVAGVGSGYGAENIATEKWGFVEPLRHKLVLAKLGATMMSVSGGNISMSRYSGSTSAWRSEIAAAGDGRGLFDEVEMKPMRLCTKIPVSKLFLQQSGADAERILLDDIVNSIAEKLEQTIFGTGAGDADTPKGLFNGVTADTTNPTFAGMVAMEETLNTAKMSGNYKFLIAPSAKTILSTTEKSSSTAKYLMESGECVGYPVECSGVVASKGVLLGDWSKLYVANWGGLDVTVDNISLASTGQILLVINSYWSYCLKDDNAIVKKILK